MDLMKIGTQLLMSKLGGGSESGLTSALSGLLGGGSGGGIDIMGLVSKMQGGGTSSGLTDLASSWLGDGDNSPVSHDQLKEMFSGDQLSEFASKLNVDESTALSGLSEALPSMVDQGSSGGSLLDMVGGVSGLMGMASKFMK